MPRIRLIILTLVRVVLSTAHRMIYSFQTEFARALGVDRAVISALVANRALFGAATPFVFPFIEGRGRKFGMALGLGLFVTGMALVVLHPSLATLGIAMVLAMLGKAFFDPSVIAYLADNSPYEKRGLITALSEVAWSSSFIVGVPVMGFLIVRFGWSSPFVSLGLLGVMALAGIIFLIHDTHAVEVHKDGALGNVRSIITSPSVLAALAIGLLATMSNEMINVNFSIWLEDSFRVKLEALALASAVIGVSELSGEGLVALLADRLGKVRATGLGLAGNCLASLLLPVIGRTETGALIGLFFFYISYEFTIVSQIPLMSEILPRARATTLSFNAAAHSLGRALGALVAPLLYVIGFSTVTGAAIVVNLLALMAVWYVSRHHK